LLKSRLSASLCIFGAGVPPITTKDNEFAEKKCYTANLLVSDVNILRMEIALVYRCDNQCSARPIEVSKMMIVSLP